MPIFATHACVLLASGGCTGCNKFEFLTGKRVNPFFQQQENTAIIKKWIKSSKINYLNQHTMRTESKLREKQSREMPESNPLGIEIKEILKAAKPSP
jgi:hypothetical protein